MRRVVIMGAAGRDFHNFNVFFRNNKDYRVVAFTATQIPKIEGRIYPKELAGELYPDGIPIYIEDELPGIIKKEGVDLVVFSYSDVSYPYVMSRASLAMANGASFMLLGPGDTMLKSRRVTISVCAVRTGAGKSQTTRAIAMILKRAGYRVAIVRHPMPYGNLVEQIAQRFSSLQDLDKYNCTIEEREEYEPHLRNGFTVYSGVDYAEILRLAEADADIILWDGGNNDFPFYYPDISVVVSDPHRAGDEIYYYPGELNLRLANIVIINKVDTADYKSVLAVMDNVKRTNPRAIILEAASPIFVDNPDLIRGKRVVVVEDGPTLTHGEMRYGAGTIAAEKYGSREIVDPRPYARGSLKEALEKYKHIGPLLPAMGYYPEQIKDLKESIESTPADVVVSATPIDLNRLLTLKLPIVHVKYELQIIGSPTLEELILPRVSELINQKK
jgi:predicted GTPase